MGSGVEAMKFRFQWNFPLLFSPHDPKLLYAGGNVLLASTNEGQSWTAISGDLTRNDKSKQGPSGGPITKDNSGVEYYATIFTVDESLLAKGLIWTGSDDGLVHITRDGGKSWTNVTPVGLPDWTQINSISASPHDPAVAYLAATSYKLDDFRPLLYRTADYGKTWTKIVNGIRADDWMHSIREDPTRKGLLYAAGQHGMYISYNDGDTWESLSLNLPDIPISDIVVEQNDLVISTHGRGFWVLDPCKGDGQSCTSGDQCCNGFCRAASDGSSVKRPDGCASSGSVT